MAEVQELGVTINPVAFLVIQSNNVKLIPVNHSSSIDKLLDYIPDLIEKTNNMMNKIVNNKKEETEKIIKEMQKKNNIINNKKEEIKTDLEENKKHKEVNYEYEYDETLNSDKNVFPEDD